jgi:NAD(P)-dependent dehydrogenase (short-subunit alcohol dehydrogenase family)
MKKAEEKRVAAVTGAASGIGKAIAERFAKDGAALALVDINREALNLVAGDLEQRYGVHVLSVVGDISDRSVCKEVFAEIVHWNVPDYWINNAGVLRLSPAEETPDDLFDNVMNTNFRSVFLFSTLFAKKVIELGRKGSIVNISSIHAVLSEPNASVYTAAKGAIEATSRTFASEWASQGIRVNCVRPGATYTELTTPIYTDEVTRAIYSRVPMRRIAQASEIAEGVYFLASDLASYCTGTTLDIDGGYVMDGSLPEVVYS